MEGSAEVVMRRNATVVDDEEMGSGVGVGAVACREKKEEED